MRREKSVKRLSSHNNYENSDFEWNIQPRIYSRRFSFRTIRRICIPLLHLEYINLALRLVCFQIHEEAELAAGGCG